MTYKATALHPIEKKILDLVGRDGSLTIEESVRQKRLDDRSGEERSGTAKIQESHYDLSRSICFL